jgi:hypothetical protein
MAIENIENQLFSSFSNLISLFGEISPIKTKKGCPCQYKIAWQNLEQNSKRRTKCN